MPLITVIIPCYNEEEVLPQLFDRLGKAAQTWGVDWRVLCVDDGSKDRTWELLAGQSAKDSRWQALRLSRNFGHQPAVSAGLAHAQGDAVIVIDADLQDPPEILGEFIAKWKEGNEVVYGVRKNRKEGPALKLAYWIFYRMFNKMAEQPMPADAGDFSLMDRRVVELLKAMPERNRYVRGLRAWSGFRQVGVPYDRPARAAGVTKYGFKRCVKLALNAIFSFSTIPLRMVSRLGLWISLVAFAGALFTLLQKIFRDEFAQVGLAPLPGYTTIVICVLFMGGIQLICLGVIGEYLGRIYDEVKGRPGWIVWEKRNLEGK